MADHLGYLAQLTAEAEAYAAAQPFERRPHDGPAIFLGVELAREGHSLQVGSYAVSDLCCHIKWVTQWPVTTSEVASTYLRRVKEGHDVPLSFAPVVTQSALYFRAPLRFHPDLAYVDISGCYPSLFFPAGFDFHYANGHGAPGEVPFKDWQHIMPDKGLRNLLWGNLLSRHNTRASHGQLSVVPVPTTANYRPYLAQYVFDSTHAIALWARANFDLRVWLTDAAILPGDEAQALIDALASEWLLTARVKWRGPGTLFGLNHRHIGEHVTRVLEKHPEQVHIGRPLYRLRNVPVDKLMALRHQLVEGELPMPPKISRLSPAICGACKQEFAAGDTVAHRRNCEVLARYRAEHPRRSRPKRARLLIGGPTGDVLGSGKLRTCANCKAKFRSDAPARRFLPRPGEGPRRLIVCPSCAEASSERPLEKLRTCANCKAKFRSDLPPQRPFPRPGKGYRRLPVCPSCLDAQEWQWGQLSSASWPVCRACRERMGPGILMVPCPGETSGLSGPAHMCPACTARADAFDFAPLPQLHRAPAGIKTDLQLRRLAPAATRLHLRLHVYRRLPGWVWWWLEEVPIP